VARFYLERLDLGNDVRRLMDLLDEGSLAQAPAGECSPPLDVIETPETLEVVMDIPGVAAESIHVIFGRNTLLIAGRKLPSACSHHAAAFHLAERTFGRFARVVQLTGAYNGGAATASLAGGELRVVLPRIADRRGDDIRIPIQAG
jgi:HSP20 family protein